MKECINILAHKANLDGSIGYGREFEKRRTQPHIGISRGYILVKPLTHRLAIAFTPYLYQQISKIWTQSNTTACKVVSQRGCARRSGYPHHLGLALKPLTHTLQMALRSRYIVAFGKDYIGTEIGFIKLREEVLWHSTHNKQRTDKHRYRTPHNHPSVTQSTLQQGGKPRHRFKRCFVRSRHHKSLTEKRHLRECQHPAEQQRHRHNHKQRLHNLRH